MATTRPFAYNPTQAVIAGVANNGTLSYGTAALDYSSKPGGLTWWMGPDENLGYIIAYVVPAGNRSTPVGNVGTVGFARSAINNPAFIQLAQSITGQTFATAAIAATWLNSNGYWTSYVEPIYGSMTLRGSNYLTIAGGSGTAMGTGDFTWECWVISNGGAGRNMTFIDTRTNPTTGDTTGFFFGTNTTGRTPIYYTNGFPLASSIDLVVNEWTHVALTRNSGIVTIWVNGVSAGTQSDTTNLTQQRVFIAGSTANFGMANYMSNIRIVKGTAVYTLPFTPPTSPLTAITGTQLLLNTSYGGNYLKDSSPNNFTVTIAGSGVPTSSKDNPFDVWQTYLQLYLDAKNTNSYPGTGSTWYDLTGNGNHVTMQNPGSISWTGGSVGYFTTGSNGWFSKISGINMPIGTGQYVISAWVQLGTTWSNQGIASVGGYGTTNQSNALKTGNTNELINSWWNNDLTASTGISPASSWFNVVIVQNAVGGNRIIYVNGIEIGRDFPGLHDVISSDIQIAKTFGTEYLNGNIGQVLIYNGRAINQVQILQNFNVTKARFGL